LVIPRDSPLAGEIKKAAKPLLLVAEVASPLPALLPNNHRPTFLIRIADETDIQGLLVLESSHKDPLRFEDRFVQFFSARCAGALKRSELARGRSHFANALIRSGGTIAAAQLSTMVVHEIKNALSNIFFTLDEVKQMPAIPTRAQAKFRAIDSELERLNILTYRLRNFSSNKLNPRRSRAYINDIVRQTLEVLESSIRRKRLVLETSLDPALNRPEEGERGNILMVDSGQISQVIINLTLNAIKASKEGGRITFTTRLEQAKVWLSVADTGSGMSTSQQKQLFKPQFGTKSKDRSGLGLLISKLIVETNHSGTFHVQSRKGKGTEVSILLPVSL
jgi:signal transduction histidine kinase